jgi:hypothetical protein
MQPWGVGCRNYELGSGEKKAVSYLLNPISYLLTPDDRLLTTGS